MFGLKKSWGLLGIAFALLLTLWSPMAPNASAATSSSDTLPGQVQTYAFGNWLRACIVAHGKTIGSADQFNNYDWFSSPVFNKNLTLGHVAANSTSNADAECTDTNRVRQAVEILGWTKTDILCELGYSNCTTTTGTVFMQPPNNIDQLSYRIFQKYWGTANQPQLTTAMRYYLYYKTFMLGCSPQKVAAAGDGVVSIKEVDATGKITDTFYKITGGAEISTYVDVGPSFNNVSPMCNTLADWASQDANVNGFATWVKANPDEAQATLGSMSMGGASSGNGTETCAISGIGWIVCPVATFLGKVTDGAYTAVEQLLVFNVAENPLDGQNVVFKIWENIRALANIAFTISFFAVIFSQATGFGISSYGAKKMLPRMAIAAILVNLSYYICIFGVDISNTIGKGLDDIIKSVPLAGGVGAVQNNQWESIISGILAGSLGGAAIGAAAYFGVLSLALPFVAFAFLAIITAIIVLVARQALLIFFIILSPLALVAYILPNTEDIFNKWRKAFVALLVMYPLIAVLFSGSQVASSVMQATASGSTGWIIQLASLGVLAFPLFGVPFIAKFSGGLLGRFAGVVNNRNKGLIDRARNKGKEMSQQSYYQRGKAIRKQAKNEFKSTEFARKMQDSSGSLRSKFARNRARGVTGMAYDATNNTPLIGAIPGVAGVQAGRQAQLNAIQRAAAGQVSRAKAEAVKDEVTRLKTATYTDAGGHRVATNKSEDTLMNYLLENAESNNEITQMAGATLLASGVHGAPGKKRLAEMLANQNYLRTRGEAAKGAVEAAQADGAFIAAHPHVGYGLNDIDYIQTTAQNGNDPANWDWNKISGSSGKVLKAAGNYASDIASSSNFTTAVAQAAKNDTTGFSNAAKEIQEIIDAKLGIVAQAQAAPRSPGGNPPIVVPGSSGGPAPGSGGPGPSGGTPNPVPSGGAGPSGGTSSGGGQSSPGPSSGSPTSGGGAGPRRATAQAGPVVPRPQASSSSWTNVAQTAQATPPQSSSTTSAPASGGTVASDGSYVITHETPRRATTPAGSPAAFRAAEAAQQSAASAPPPQPQAPPETPTSRQNRRASFPEGPPPGSPTAPTVGTGGESSANPYVPPLKPGVTPDSWRESNEK